MTVSDLPFILIASLRRTGSTVLSEALTQLPWCYIFQEPYLAFGHFFYSQYDADQFNIHGIDLSAYRTSWLGYKVPSLVDKFKSELQPELRKVARQIGVKEIRLRHWHHYVKAYPDIRILLTGRDPRDVYISLFNRYQNGLADWKGPFNAFSVAEDLLREFGRQTEMSTSCKCMLVKYEDLCTKNALMDEIRQFTGNKIPDAGGVGTSLSHSSVRSVEYAVHGTRITSKRVNRWKTERNQQLLDEAQQTFELMSEYNSFWGYH